MKISASRASKRAPTWYSCMITPKSLSGQPLDRLIQTRSRGWPERDFGVMVQLCHVGARFEALDALIFIAPSVSSCIFFTFLDFPLERCESQKKVWLLWENSVIRAAFFWRFFRQLKFLEFPKSWVFEENPWVLGKNPWVFGKKLEFSEKSSSFRGKCWVFATKINIKPQYLWIISAILCFKSILGIILHW